MIRAFAIAIGISVVPDCLCSSVPDHPDETPRLDRDFVLDRLDLIANSSRTVDTESFDPRTTLKFSNQMALQ